MKFRIPYDSEPMLSLQLSKPFGKIYQVKHMDAKKELVFIQTYGIKKENSYCCTSDSDLRELLNALLKHPIYERVVIDSILTLNISLETITLFYGLAVCGIDVYLVIKEKGKLWFIDEMLAV